LPIESRQTALVVASSDKLRSKLAEILEKVLGLHVRSCGTPRAAGEGLSVGRKPEFVVLSLAFPVKELQEFTSLLHARNSNAQIIGLEWPAAEAAPPDVCDRMLPWPLKFEDLVTSFEEPHAD